MEKSKDLSEQLVITLCVLVFHASTV